MILSLPELCGVSEGQSLVGLDRLSLDNLLAALRAREPEQMFAATALMADRRITVECDDQLFFSDFFAMFGGSEPAPGRLAIPSDMHVEHSCAHRTRSLVGFECPGAAMFPSMRREFNFAVELDQGNFVLSSAHRTGLEMCRISRLGRPGVRVSRSTIASLRLTRGGASASSGICSGACCGFVPTRSSFTPRRSEYSAREPSSSDPAALESRQRRSRSPRVATISSATKWPATCRKPAN